ncbi:MAG: hypothetical protein K0U29_06605 [Gammaproteobacteria bacterium]|nr:hypothetical protein [Gammaproteobacteria bacterium]MCH9744584.1 hypothetical protein [Gammaproteobacteria bacterium]
MRSIQDIKSELIVLVSGESGELDGASSCCFCFKKRPRLPDRYVEMSLAIIKFIKANDDFLEIQNAIQLAIDTLVRAKTTGKNHFYQSLVAANNLLSDAREKGIKPEGYDIRGNLIAATIVESMWAFEMIQAMSNADSVSFIKDVFRKIYGICGIEADFLSGDQLQDPLEIFFYYDKNLVEERVEDLIEQDMRNRVPVPELESYEGGIAPKPGRPPVSYEEALSISRAQIFGEVREVNFFDDEGGRGRRNIPYEQRADRISSVEGPDMGIVATGYTPIQLRKKLPDTLPYHGKGCIRRQPAVVGHDFSTFLQARDAPFIGGTSGTITYVLALTQSLSLSKHDMERFMLYFLTCLILLGHHSLFECIVTCQYIGLFDQVPFIETLPAGKDQYQIFITGFSAVLSEFKFPPVPDPASFE